MTIVELIQRKYPGFRVSPGTGWVSAVCPFHDDRNASASVNLELGWFQCRACPVRGGVKEMAETLQLESPTVIQPERRVTSLKEALEAPLNDEDRSRLWNIAFRYSQAYDGSPAREYMSRRAVTHPLLWGLGYVADPVPEHERFKGWLSIPYFRMKESGLFVIKIRFRCIEDHDHTGHGKYSDVAGAKVKLFNTLAILDAKDTIGICEGEMDAMALTDHVIPTVGVPGAQSWRPEFASAFAGFKKVVVYSDGDAAGESFGEKVTDSLTNSTWIVCDQGEDAESMIRKGRTDGLRPA